MNPPLKTSRERLLQDEATRRSYRKRHVLVGAGHSGLKKWLWTV